MSDQPKRPYSYIETAEQLDSLVGEMRDAERIALDTEADSLHHYFEKVCLIQLTIKKQCYIIDPLQDLNLGEFLKVLSQKKLILHGADYDLRMMRSSFGFEPKNEIFDTMLAAQLIGCKSFSLIALAEQFLNVALTKQSQKSNWSKRPLTDQQLIYASDDTRYLIPLADKLINQLRKLDREQWWRESCCAMVVATGNIKKVDPENLWRIKGSKQITRKQQNIVREIWHWREEQAKRMDLPPFKVMTNKLIIDLAVWAVENPHNSIENGPKLPRNFNGKRLFALEEAIEQAQGTANYDWPKPPERKRSKPCGKNCKEIVNSLKEHSLHLAEELGIEAYLLASRATIATIANNRPGSFEDLLACGMMSWQAKLLEPAIKHVLKYGS